MCECLKIIEIRQSATKLLKVYKSMEKVQRIDIELKQAIIYPRVPNILKRMKIYAGLYRNI